ncbi:hypothetical protein BLNAU_22392 [Blattamonas nauphoetae]|uniref:Uncharacterized protein n=1 Tax=Blattamonas nauphoetae TaxID=2049346 RepID=A0ABQ9WT66_9EUKA|nr:hypothetical protein BLNAU_22392 [Blattamonas nauphoetae]
MTRWFRFLRKAESDVENIVYRGGTIGEILLCEDFSQELFQRNSTLISFLKQNTVITSLLKLSCEIRPSLPSTNGSRYSLAFLACEVLAGGYIDYSSLFLTPNWVQQIQKYISGEIPLETLGAQYLCKIVRSLLENYPHEFYGHILNDATLGGLVTHQNLYPMSDLLCEILSSQRNIEGPEGLYDWIVLHDLVTKLIGSFNIQSTHVTIQSLVHILTHLLQLFCRSELVSIFVTPQHVISLLSLINESLEQYLTNKQQIPATQSSSLRSISSPCFLHNPLIQLLSSLVWMNRVESMDPDVKMPVPPFVVPIIEAVDGIVKDMKHYTTRTQIDVLLLLSSIVRSNFSLTSSSITASSLQILSDLFYQSTSSLLLCELYSLFECMFTLHASTVGESLLQNTDFFTKLELCLHNANSPKPPTPISSSHPQRTTQPSQLIPFAIHLARVLSEARQSSVYLGTILGQSSSFQDLLDEFVLPSLQVEDQLSSLIKIPEEPQETIIW